MKNYLVEYFIGLGLFISQEVRAEDPEDAIFRIFPEPAETYWKVSCRGYGYASVNYYRVAGGVLVADNDSISMWSGDGWEHCENSGNWASRSCPACSHLKVRRHESVEARQVVQC